MTTTPTRHPAHRSDTALPAAPTGGGGRHRAAGPGRQPTTPHRFGSPGACRAQRITAVMSFTTVVAVANAGAYHLGLLPVGFGLYATASTAAVAVIAIGNTWLREMGGPRLVAVGIATATVVSTCAAGAFGLAWGLAYAVAELVGACTWRPLRELDRDHPRVLVAAGLTSLVEASVYVTLLGAVVDASVAGQLLGKAEAAIVTFAVAAPAVALWRHRRRVAAAAGRLARRIVAHRRRVVVAVLAAGLFAGSVTAANTLTASHGLIGVGLGLTATAGTYAAGLCLLARDWLHEAAGRTAVLAAIACGGAASAALAGPRLALASAAAFVVSELADLAVYQPLRRRGFIRAVVASNAVGAPVDTILFLALAGFPIWTAVPGQLLAKATATAVPVAVVLIARAVLRHRQRTEGA